MKDVDEGDILICKKDYGLKFIKNRKYIICQIAYGNIQILYLPEYGEWFRLDWKSNIKCCVDDFFYTKEEIRKLKLESI